MNNGLNFGLIMEAVTTTDYESLQNKPSIGGVPLVGDLALNDLGTPTYAENLKSWGERDSLNVESEWEADLRTTAGDTSIDSSKGGKLMSIIAKSDFSASSFIETGYNQLRRATAIGSGYYFLVPALPFGSYGTANKPNGILFTDSSGDNLTPTVYFKPYSDGVPASVTDGTACTYTDSNGLRFYTTAQLGYIIVSGITLSDTCAKIAWSRRYNDYVSVSDSNDAGTTINLSPLFAWMHSDVQKMLTVGTGASQIGDMAERYSDTQMRGYRYVGLATDLTWTDTADIVGEGETQTYTHSVTISGIKVDGLAEIYGSNTALTVNGTTVSFQDTNATASGTDVKYQLATPTNALLNIQTALTLEDWGIEGFVDVSGEAEVVCQYAQGYPDALALIAQYKIGDAIDDIDANTSRIDEIEECVVDEPSAADYDELPLLCGQPMILFSNGVPAAATVPDNWIPFSEGGYEWNGTPSALGQVLINYAVTSGGRYTAVRDGNYGLKWINS